MMNPLSFSAGDAPVLDRIIDLPTFLKQKSHFLFGPRQTGKTFLIRRSLPNARVYDLLQASTYLTLSRDPGRIEAELTDADEWVVVDEVQRLPGLLNEVHRLIEERGIRFLLTGSSARKLRRGGVNLLGGRARTKRLHPLTRFELGPHFVLQTAIARGTLPAIYFSDDAAADLEAYAGSYLQEEIVAEGATRNVPAFSRLLQVVAVCNATIVNYTKLANDAQMARTTVHEYFDILKDTLILHELPAWRETRKRKAISSSKFYFFDVGVVGNLQGRSCLPGSPEFGSALETYLMHELVCYRDYQSADSLTFWRSTSGFEVDFVLGDHTAIEVKASQNVSRRDLKGLRAFAEDCTVKHLVCVSLEQRARRLDDVHVIPVEQFLDDLWAGKFA